LPPASVNVDRVLRMRCCCRCVLFLFAQDRLKAGARPSQGGGRNNAGYRTANIRQGEKTSLFCAIYI
jgi:hypothetical protein